MKEIREIAKNKSIKNYEVLKRYEAGIVLKGPEVKSIKLGEVDLKSAYCSFENGELYIKDMYVARYKPASLIQKNYNPREKRKLLLHKKQLNSLLGYVKQKGYTIIPIKIYEKNNLIKLEIALTKGLKKFEKKEKLKKKAIELEIRRTLKYKE